jgi:hypothetical protein
MLGTFYPLLAFNVASGRVRLKMKHVERLDSRREIARLLVSNANLELRAVPEIWR